MASFSSRNGKIQAQVMAGGKRRSKTFKTKREAKAWAAQVEAEHQDGRTEARRYGDSWRDTELKKEA